jgi:hypothetical protein
MWAEWQAVAPFMGARQRSCLQSMIRGEERAAAIEIVERLAATIETMPTTYQTDGQGDAAKVILHYFHGGCDWHIIEKDVDGGTPQAFGLANLGYGAELGYISIDELTQHHIELDFYWTPKTLGEIKQGGQS